MSSITISSTEKKRLETKAKAGWASYYALLNRFDDLSDYVYHQQERNRELRLKLNNPDNDIDIKYLKDQFIEMYDKLKDYSECPVCFETITKNTAKLGNCGHLVCLTCFEKLTDCPICRKKYYKPRAT
jgi:hypothetical protein